MSVRGTTEGQLETTWGSGCSGNVCQDKDKSGCNGNGGEATSKRQLSYKQSNCALILAELQVVGI